MSASFNRRRTRALAGLLVAGLSVGIPAAASAQQPPQCAPAGAAVQVPDLLEGSGVAASRRTPGRFWAHNDSGEPVLIALDGDGRVTGRTQLAGAAVDDWEAVAVGPCAGGSCLYVADIGDNDAKRKQITIYRALEPAEATGTVKVEAVHATYPDGAHDAETLLVTPDGRLSIVTKGDTGPVAIYRFPADLRGTVRLERVGEPRQQPGRTGAADRVTDGAVSPDGQWVALRSTQMLTFYKAADLLSGNWREAGRLALTPIREPQGEGVTFGSDNTIFLMSEGGGRKQPGRFSRLTCAT